MRESGILLPITSLPSKYGIGCFSKDALEFIDFLKGAGQKNWQILPMGPTGYGDSPYQSFSTFAGNPYFVDLETLIKEGLLTEKECDACDFGDNDAYVDYEKQYQNRFDILKKAFARFVPDEGYEAFVKEEAFWLDDYCLYTAIKKSQGNVCWSDWEAGLRNRKVSALKKARKELKKEIEFYQFIQYMFYKQWNVIHEYAKENDIKIIGDLPIYVSFDSADAWANPKLFQFTKDGFPKAVAGCPPDAFSKTGQLWGNPLYNWRHHKKTGYEWWMKRIEYALKQVDVLRIDHFRGFDEYYAIPYGDKTAEKGKWMKGPGIELFTAIKEKLGDVNIIAEDLGMITDSVRELLKETGYPGMKVLQFAFDSGSDNAYLPFNFTNNNCVVYTGTHDNDTTMGWYETLAPAVKKVTRRYFNNWYSSDGAVVWDFIRLAESSIANLCVIPMQDFLCLGKEARINTPSTLGNNFKWRLVKNQLSEQLREDILDMVTVYGRFTPEPEEVEAEELTAEENTEVEADTNEKEE